LALFLCGGEAVVVLDFLGKAPDLFVEGVDGGVVRWPTLTLIDVSARSVRRISAIRAATLSGVRADVEKVVLRSCSCRSVAMSGSIVSS